MHHCVTILSLAWWSTKYSELYLRFSFEKLQQKLKPYLVSFFLSANYANVNYFLAIFRAAPELTEHTALLELNYGMEQTRRYEEILDPFNVR